MVAIKDFGMPSCCATCFYDRCEHKKDAFIRYSKEDFSIPSDCPLAEIEERKVGKWILSRPGIYTCSICGLDTPAGEVNHQGYEYCPKCGNRLER